MKKAFTVLTLVFVVLMMVGCSNGSTDPNNNNGGEPKFPTELVGYYNPDNNLNIDYGSLAFEGSVAYYDLVSINNKTIKVKCTYSSPVYEANANQEYTLCTNYTFESKVLTFTGGNVPDVSNTVWTKYKDGID